MIASLTFGTGTSLEKRGTRGVLGLGICNVYVPEVPSTWSFAIVMICQPQKGDSGKHDLAVEVQGPEMDQFKKLLDGALVVDDDEMPTITSQQVNFTFKKMGRYRFRMTCGTATCTTALDVRDKKDEPKGD